MSASSDRPRVDGIDNRERDTIGRVRQLSDDIQAGVTLAVNAAVCGGTGCREVDVLLKLVVEGSQRVLCENQSRDFLEVAA